MRRWFGASSFDERERSIASVAAEQEIPAYAAQLEEEYRYDGVWEMRCPGFLRIGEVAALPDRALLGWLDRLSGLRLPRTLAILDEAPEFASAWQLALRVYMTQTLAEADQDLLGLLAVEVWKRRRPDRPCLEVLLDEEFAAHVACLTDAGNLGRYLAFVRRVFPLLQGDNFDDATLGARAPVTSCCAWRAWPSCRCAPPSPRRRRRATAWPRRCAGTTACPSVAATSAARSRGSSPRGSRRSAAPTRPSGCAAAPRRGESRDMSVLTCPEGHCRSDMPDQPGSNAVDAAAVEPGAGLDGRTRLTGRRRRARRTPSRCRPRPRRRWRTGTRGRRRAAAPR
ncbi:hypothetical protein OV079_35335 [Nannocystis pusilla]|uniref:Uncharacterized protein n=1 Tax=Nannocystis pusilla TaxID=889268 RepID=A0A9X3EUX8_9BACT|nr:hypothetical protein [Nannocystis pusilla]MCY1010748.1 hypothetical protein [Nannocystis pusilla]